MDTILDGCACTKGLRIFTIKTRTSDRQWHHYYFFVAQSHTISTRLECCSSLQAFMDGSRAMCTAGHSGGNMGTAYLWMGPQTFRQLHLCGRAVHRSRVLFYFFLLLLIFLYQMASIILSYRFVPCWIIIS